MFILTSGLGYLLSLSIIFTVAVSQMNSPAPSTEGIKRRLCGVNLSNTMSSYSRVTSSLAVKRQNLMVVLVVYIGFKFNGLHVFKVSKFYEFECCSPLGQMWVQGK